jgi:Homeodomain-like domain
MPSASPYRIVLTDDERRHLEAAARRYTSPYREVVRARIVLYAAEGLGNDEIAARLDTPRQVVSKWRKRFCNQRLADLGDLPRGGRPPAFPPEVVVAVRPWPANCPRRQGYRWPAGIARTWPAPWIRRYPGSGFSFASRTTRRAMPGTVGAPGGLAPVARVVLARGQLAVPGQQRRWRYGKTSVQRLGGMSRARAANHTRSAGS